MAVDNNLKLKLITYNMHGFFQGQPTIHDLILSENPDVIFVQEHWLNPANLGKFDTHFSDFFSFRISAMSNVVDCGMLRGRPFGGVLTLINNRLRAICESVYCSERYVIIRVAN